VIIYENVNLPHIRGRTCKKNPFMTRKLSNFSNGSQIWFKLCEMICEITTINFMKAKNHFNHFWSIFAFFSTMCHAFFSCKYTPSHHNIKQNDVSLFFWVMLYHNIQKHCENLL
jgi:hypothetical protein